MVNFLKFSASLSSKLISTIFPIRLLSLLIIGVALLLLNKPFCLAGQVSLTIATEVSTGLNKAHATVTVTNTGSDEAKDLSIQATYEGKRFTNNLADSLLPGKNAKTIFTFPLAENKKGKFPVFLLLFYNHEGNPRQFSAPALAFIQTSETEHSPLSLEITQDKLPIPSKIILTLESKETITDPITITSLTPREVKVSPKQQKVFLQDNKAIAIVSIDDTKGLAASEYPLFFTAEYQVAETNFLVDSVSRLSIPEKPYQSTQKLQPWSNPLLISIFLIMAVVLYLLFILRLQKINDQTSQPKAIVSSIPLAIDLLILLTIELYIAAQLPTSLLFTDTITTGGDTASHFYTLQYFTEQLLPAGRISGWNMGNYGGFPILQFYFPLPFLMMKAISVFSSLQVAFKLVSMVGTFLLPLCIYQMLRLMRLPFPVPALGAVFMLPFIFNTANSMWGGNILSTLAGEFSYSLSMSLSFLLIGSLYRGARENCWVMRNGILVFLVGFSHGYTLLFVELMSLFLLLSPAFFLQRFVYLLKVYSLGFLLLAFWLVPLLLFGPYTTPYHIVWIINSWQEVIPLILLPGAFLAAAVFPLLFYFRKKLPSSYLDTFQRPATYFFFGLGSAIALYVAAPRIGVVDIRYIPYAQIFVQLLAAVTLGSLFLMFQHHRPVRLFLGLFPVVVFFWIQPHTNQIYSWSQWNYEGFESKQSWPLFQQINQQLSGSFQDPRVAYEHSSQHNTFGSSRAFESLPLFGGRSTLEGLYMQASPSAPFVFYIQSLISKEASRPFPQYSYPTMDFARALPRLQLFNVRELIIRSKEAKNAIRKVKGYSLIRTHDQYEIWQVSNNSLTYSVPLKHEPVLYTGSDWKGAAYRWFQRDTFLDIPFVFGKEKQENTPFLGPIIDHIPENPPITPAVDNKCEVEETILDQEIHITTNCIDRPLLIKVSYHPNWHVKGARQVYLAAPSFMLIYPDQSEIILTYGPGKWERVGQLLTFLGIVVLLLNLPVSWGERKSLAMLVFPGFSDLSIKISNPQPHSSILQKILAGCFGIAILSAVWFCYYSYHNETSRIFNQSIRLKDAKHYAEARVGFEHTRGKLPLSSIAQQASYYIGISYYLEGKDSQAIAAFKNLVENEIDSPWIPAAYYHLGLVYQRNGSLTDAKISYGLAIKTGKNTSWGQYAGNELRKLRK